MAYDDAVIEASSTRLRPVLMTTLTTVMGSVPLFLGGGPGAETRLVVGVVIMFGVAVSAVLTLIVVPLAYRAISRRTGSPGDMSRKVDAALAAAGK